MTALLFAAVALAADTRIDPATLSAFDTHPDQVAVSGTWWAPFADPRLDAVMDAAAADSPAVAGAFGRLQQARAAAMAALAPALPRASFDVTATGQPLENVAFCVVGQPDFTNPPSGDWCWQGSARLNASWQLDVFARTTTSWIASNYEAQASEGDLDAQRLNVAASVASAYLDAVAAQRQLAILDAQLANQRDLLAIVELRYEQGSSTSLDVLQQRSATAATDALLPPARLNALAARQRLAVLLGRDPATPIDLAADLPDVGPPPAAGTPADLARRRPDLRAAADRFDATQYRVTSTAMALAPTLTANASAGWAYALTEDLSTLDVWSVGGTLSVPILNGGSTWANLRSARAGREQQTAAYDQLLLDAVAEVRNAQARDRESQLRQDAIDAQLTAATLAYRESRERYLAGVDTFLTVLTAWNSLQQSELNSLQAHRDVLAARIALFVALGGPGAQP